MTDQALAAAPLRGLHFLVYTPQKSSTIADALGKADYSYFFVMQHFAPLLRRFGEVTVVSDPTAEVARIRARGDTPLLLLFMPPHKVPAGLPCPALPVFAWEYTDIPDEAWNGEARSDWRRVLREAGGGITHSAFAADAIRRAMGRDFAIGSLPAPIWDRYSRLVERKPGDAVQRPWTLRFDGGLLDSHALSLDADGKPRAPVGGAQSATLSGVVYTAVLNPLDGRKNWGDIITAFVWALGEEAQATLLLKLVHSDLAQGCGPILDRLAELPPHRCRIVVAQGYLSDAAYETMIAGTSYVVNAATGEGQCLPLMEFMSAGTPAIAPDHTAMQEYVSAANSFVLRSSDEWTQWPHDGRGVLRCFTLRVSWDSLREAFGTSFTLAMQDPARYRAMGEAASEALRAYCSEAIVSRSLERFLARWRRRRRLLGWYDRLRLLGSRYAEWRPSAVPLRSSLRDAVGLQAWRFITAPLRPVRRLAKLIRARLKALR
jgi:glycosyltransferase involved in cell wall biosynthesis